MYFLCFVYMFIVDEEVEQELVWAKLLSFKESKYYIFKNLNLNLCIYLWQVSNGSL